MPEAKKTQQKDDNVPEPYNYHQTESLEMSKGEVIGIGLIGSIMLGLVGWAIWTDVKNQQELEENIKKDREEREAKKRETMAWRDSERAKGNVTLRLANGDLIAISAEAYQNAVIRAARDS